MAQSVSASTSLAWRPRRSRQLRAGLPLAGTSRAKLGHLPKCIPHLGLIRFVKLKKKKKKKKSSRPQPLLTFKVTANANLTDT